MEFHTVNRIATSKRLAIELPVDDFHTVNVPGLYTKKGVCYVKVTDLPAYLDNYMEVNPRLPSRSKSGSLQGPVVKGILATLLEHPEEMSLRNQGIYLLVKEMHYEPSKHRVRLLLGDSTYHGIINGGHTYAAIRQAVENATPEQREKLKKAYVQLHIFKDIEKLMVPHIAEALNRSKQVDDLSLINLQGGFDQIRKALAGTPGEFAVSYHQGAEGSVSLSDILVMLEMFNIKRFNAEKGPYSLYAKKSLGLKYFKLDSTEHAKIIEGLIAKLPQILRLSDEIKKRVPISAKKAGFKFGMAKIGEQRTSGQSVYLPFIDETVSYRVPNGWVYPILAAFRANLTESRNGLRWTMDPFELLDATIDQLVSVCVSEHKKGNKRPDAIGKSEAVYNQCYAKLELFLVRKGLS
jgi:hypothetical protein